jgi:hypothetical protein
MEERASAIAGPALVYVEARFDGALRTKQLKQPLHEGSITVVRRCSGFVINDTGYALSSSRCLQPTAEVLRGAAAHLLADQMLKDKKLSPEQRDAFVSNTIATAEFADSAGGSNFEPKIFGQRFRAFGGLTSLPATDGRIMTPESARGTDVTLVKFSHEGMGAVELATRGVERGSRVVLVGFYTSDNLPDAASYVPNMRVATVTGEVDGKPGVYKLDADVGNYSHGGMALDESGRVIGMIVTDVTAKDQANRALIESVRLNGVLTAANVANKLSAQDQTYRAGLDDYFAGRYSAARTKLDQVIAATPVHTYAVNYRKSAAERLAVEGDPEEGLPQWAKTLILALAGLLVVLFVVLIVAVVRLRRAKRIPTPEELYGPISVLPASVSPFPISGAGFGQPGAQTEYSNVWMTPPAQPIDAPTLLDYNADPTGQRGNVSDISPTSPWQPRPTGEAESR